MPLTVFAELVKLNVVTPLFIDALAKATLAVAVSLTYTLPFNAWAVNVVAATAIAFPTPLPPTLPFNESKPMVGAVKLPLSVVLLIDPLEIMVAVDVPVTAAPKFTTAVLAMFVDVKTIALAEIVEEFDNEVAALVATL